MTQRLWIDKINFDREDIFAYVKSLKDNNPNFTLIDVGASHNPFAAEYLTHTFDLRPNDCNAVSFLGNMCRADDWQQIFDYVDKHGKFDFVNCTHTLEDIANPIGVLDYLPRIAKEGFIAVPSKFYELQRREPFRGAIHHRWIWDIVDQKLVGYPKLNLIEHINYGAYEEEIKRLGNTEIKMFWKNTIDYKFINDDYMGPTREAVIEMFIKLIVSDEDYNNGIRPEKHNIKSNNTSATGWHRIR